MNAQQQQKAAAALERQKEKERKQRHAMMYHLLAFGDLHFEGVLLPYRILYDLHRAEHEKTFNEVFPNKFYPHPAITLKTKYSFPRYEGDFNSLPKDKDGLPILSADLEHMKKVEEYKQREEAEKLSIDNWGYYYARFLLPYDLSSFTSFDWWGELPKNEEAKKVVDGLKAACIEVQADYKMNPQNYNTEPVLKKEEHKTIYDVGYGYI
ncbi:MAG: hypothetical protein NC548_36535 [Lachnospiraceae bacterium]|nr:hypothetical protein [Lachnospiraceae bacterium]